MKQHECATTKICSVCSEELPETMFYKNNRRCKDCIRISLSKWRAENPEKRKAQRIREYEKDGDKYRAYSQEYRKAYPEKTREAGKRWDEANRDYIREKRRERYALDEEFRNLLKSHNSARHKRLRTSMPKWVTRDILRPIFLEAIMRTEDTGIQHHVDHILPLKGENFSGLTVPWNLRVVPYTENCKKSDKLVEDIVWT
jgi:hypothetical protein